MEVYGQDGNRTLPAAPGTALPSTALEKKLTLVVAEPLDACQPLVAHSYAGACNERTARLLAPPRLPFALPYALPALERVATTRTLLARLPLFASVQVAQVRRLCGRFGSAGRTRRLQLC